MYCISSNFEVCSICSSAMIGSTFFFPLLKLNLSNITSLLSYEIVFRCLGHLKRLIEVSHNASKGGKLIF